MSETVTIELIGGPGDGRLFAVPDEFLSGTGTLQIPVAPSLAEMLDGYGNPSNPDVELGYRVLIYQWDGTVREDGVRRFRLR